MASTNIRYRFKDTGGLTGYRTDIGGNLNLNPVLKTHIDFTDTIINGILDAIDAELRTETIPCGEASSFNPRKLTFIRRNGRSFSVTVPDRSKLLTAADAIALLLVGTDAPIVCVDLKGETSGNILDILAVNKPALAAVAPIQPSAVEGYKSVYSASMANYVSDVVYGVPKIQRFQSQSDVEDAPYSQLSAEILGCVGDTTEVSCGSRAEVFDYRRFNVSILTQEDGTTVQNLQTVNVPVAKHLPADILDCGTKLASKEMVACIEYFGQSMRMNKFVNL